MLAKLPSSRIPAIDAFRGLTIFLMIFVNELAGVDGIGAWMKHAAADDDAMTFVDVVFPAFLFIVGMSIPFSMQAQLIRGDSWLKIFRHVIVRGIGLLVIGVFMVNAEGDFNEEAMDMSIHAWSSLFYAGVLLVWLDYKFTGRGAAFAARGIGIVLLIVAAALYRDEAGSLIGPRWWGILGLIGWAYMVGCGLYVISRANTFILLLLVLSAMTYYTLGHVAFRQNAFYHHPLFSQGGHAIHTSIVIAGTILTLIFYRDDLLDGIWRRYNRAVTFAVVMLFTGLYFRPFMGVSKIYATPSWAAFSIVICAVTFGLLYLVTERWGITRWTTVLKPAANNPLVVYIIPYILYAIMELTGISFPGFLYQGTIGILWALCYAVLVMLAGWMLTRVNVRLRL
jgi:heparan-alpha-glucosaminide N-acetyltransferase